MEPTVTMPALRASGGIPRSCPAPSQVRIGKLPAHVKRLTGAADVWLPGSVSRWGTAAATTTVWSVARCDQPT